VGDLAIATVLQRAVATRSSTSLALKSMVSDWVGKTIKLTDGGFWSAFFGADSNSGQHVSARTVLSLSTAWACCRLVAETIATLPCGIYERAPDGSSVAARSHPLFELLHDQPNGDMTSVEFWEVVLVALMLWGNSFGEKLYSGSRVIAIDFLEPHRMNVRRLTDGSLEYRYTDVTGHQRVIPEALMWHLKAFSQDGVMGLSSIRYGANTFGAALAADQASAKVFANGMNVGGTLSTDKNLNTEQREEYRENFAAKFAGAMNAGKTMVLEAGLKYQQVPMNPEDAQLLATRGFNVEEICRWFRVPPVMVGHGDKQSSWPTSTEAQGQLFLTHTLSPWLARIEKSIRKSLLTPAERLRYFAKFSVEGLLRADSAGRAAYYASGLQNGWINRAQVAAREDLPKPVGGDIYTVQSNLVPIDKLGAVAPPAEAAKSGLLRLLGLPQEQDDAA